MIFGCGRTRAQRQKELENWHDWFAWHPVTVREENGRATCAWLQTVERKGETRCSQIDGLWWTWKYRLGGELS